MSGSKRILVVEDDESIRTFVQMALVDAGHEVVEASNGAAALALLGPAQPDVILLDMLMPVMDGWEFAQRYRQLPGPHAPIIVLTAARDSAQRADEIDATGVLDKPFRMQALLTCVDAATVRATDGDVTRDRTGA